MTATFPVFSRGSADFLDSLRSIVGDARLLTDPRQTQPYRTGFRCGIGHALAVVRPRSLIELWRVLEACVAANKIVIVQAANTGLTGGSTPAGSDYDRDVVIVSTQLLTGIQIIQEGREAICLPGAALHRLEEALKPHGREPHSVIGSSCIGASVIGGICNNSGGALLQRGPAYTQMALFARLDGEGRLQLINHLGIRLGAHPEEVLGRLERGEFGPQDIERHSDRLGSDRDYGRRVREIDAGSPARFNADPRCLFEASGSAGRVVVFAVRLDTFPQERDTRVFYIGTRDPDELTALRRHILSRFAHLPIAAEYLHRDMFDVAARYGKDTFLAIRCFGPRRLPGLLKLKGMLDSALSRFGAGRGAGDRILQRLSRCFPNHLPARMLDFRDRFEHHLLLKVAGAGIEEATAWLRTVFPSAAGDCFECSREEADQAFLHRFVAAGAAVRYAAIHADEVEDVLALDVALRRNERQWFEPVPAEVAGNIHLALHYGHFFCHVFHQDYLIRRGGDAEALKRRLCERLDEKGAEYPAEHNVGHLYRAKPALAGFYRSLDPCNQFNPGIGLTSKRSRWQPSSK